MPDIAGPDGFPESELPLTGKDVYIFTDGVTEAKTEDGGMVGIDRIKAMLRAGNHLPAKEQVNQLAAALLKANVKQRDDITLLVIRGPETARAKGGAT